MIDLTDAEANAFFCGEHLDQRRAFRTFAELEAHRHAEHTARGQMGMVAALCPIASPQNYACTLREGHAGLCQDGCGNKWGSSTAITGKRGIYSCDLYHPTAEFDSYSAWSHHNKTVHLDMSHVVRSHDGSYHAFWNPGAESRPCVALTGAEVCGYEVATGAFCTRRKGDCMGHLQPAPIVMKRLGDLPPEAQADVRRLLTEANRELRELPVPKINPICIAKPEPAPRDPPAFCAVCHLRAPEEIGYLANVNAKGLRPKLDGWMIAAFPYTSTEGVVSEAKRLCPPCGEKVAKFIAHLSTPMLHEEDLL